MTSRQLLAWAALAERRARSAAPLGIATRGRLARWAP